MNPRTFDYKIFIIHTANTLALEQTINSIKDAEDDIVVFNNSNKHISEKLKERVSEIKPLTPQSLSQTMNTIFQMGVAGHLDFVIICHDDFHMITENGMTKFIDSIHPAFDMNEKLGALFASIKNPPSAPDVIAAFPYSVFSTLKWNTYFPQYYGDSDFYRRFQLAGFDAEALQEVEIEHLNGGSSTMKLDETHKLWVDTMFESWKAFYVAMWGGEPGHEQFLTPFNK